VPMGASPQMQPRTVTRGNFVEVDVVHKGSGAARIVEQGGVRYLRLEDFEVTNGPDLRVYLVSSRQPGSTLSSLGDYIDLGPLKGSAGNQTYDIPAGAESYSSVVIWCREFSVLFSYAVLQ